MAENTTFKRPLPTVGVDKYTFFPLTADTAEALTYGDAVSLPGTVEIAPTDAGGSDVFDADNGAYVVETYLEKIGHEITNADIPPEVDAMWRGLTKDESGVISVKSGITTKYFGVAWRVQKSDGTYRYIRYFKGSYSFASNVGGKTRPSTGASEKQTAKATYTAVQTEHDDRYYEYIDEANFPAGLTRAEFEAEWFKSPTWTVAKTTG